MESCMDIEEEKVITKGIDKEENIKNLEDEETEKNTKKMKKIIVL